MAPPRAEGDRAARARLFVALDIPAELRRGLASWQESFDDPALRAVRPEALHMTLVFLGSRDAAEVEAIADAAFARVDSPAPLVELEPEPVGIPGGKRPRLFALSAPSPQAEALQRQVESGLVAAGLHEPEARPFWPHLTVARVRAAKPGGRRPAVVERPPAPVPEHTFLRPTALVRLVLFRSLQRRGGAVYEPMAELELPTADETER